jgi:F-type H+-transporting ATPase subunit b
MSFDWTTFFLEIINFLILVWLLKRFLYKPVTNAIARRKTAIEMSLAKARAAQEEAQGLKQQYQNRLGEWSREKEQARAKMHEEIAAERERLLTALQTTVEQEREISRVLEQRRQEELRRVMEEKAFALGGQFVARLFSRVADPELEAKLIDLVVEELPHLPEEQLETIHALRGKADFKVTVISAYPLTDDQRAALIGALTEISGEETSCEFTLDKRLVAGVRINIGPWVLRANLEDELKFFIEGTPRED